MLESKRICIIKACWLLGPDDLAEHKRAFYG